MAIEVHLPRVTQTAEKASITRWLKSEGDWVEKGEVLFEMETDKANVEVESPGTGVLGQIFLRENESRPIGTLVALIFSKGEDIRKRDTTSLVPNIANHVEEKVELQEKVPTSAEREIRATPLAKRIGRELGMDLAMVKGSGPGGRIEKEDVERAKSAGLIPSVKPAIKSNIVKLSATRETIARRMAHSFQTAPHFYLSLEADMKAVQELRESLMNKMKPTFTDLLVLIVAKALKEYPRLNSSWTGEGIMLKEEINIGVAVESEAGLVVPVIKGVDQKSLAEISHILSSMIEKGRNKKLSVEELTGGTFTITNMGMLGIERFDAIINPPESAILSFGKIIDKVVVIQAGIHIRPRMDMTLSVDHRVLDGADAARFLVRVKELIENPGAVSL